MKKEPKRVIAHEGTPEEKKIELVLVADLVETVDERKMTKTASDLIRLESEATRPPSR
jgi:precorrin-4 methylase